MAKQTKTSSQNQAILQPYVLAHLAEEMQDFANIQDDILVFKKHPGLSSINATAEHKSSLEKFAAEKLAYIEKTIKDLRTAGYK